MTESSESKSKRKIIKYLSDYEWKEQYSIFPQINFDDLDSSKEFAKDGVLEFFDALKVKLRKSVETKDIAFFIRLRKKNKSFNFNIEDEWEGRKQENHYITSLYVHILCSQECNLNKIIESVYSDEFFNLRSRSMDDEKLIRYCKTVKEQKLYDLKGLTNKRLQKYYLINEKALVLRDESLKSVIYQKLEYIGENPTHKQQYVRWSNRNVVKENSSTAVVNDDGWD